MSTNRPRPWKRCICDHPNCTHFPNDCHHRVRWFVTISPPDEPIRTAPLCFRCSAEHHFTPIQKENRL